MEGNQFSESALECILAAYNAAPDSVSAVGRKALFASGKLTKPKRKGTKVAESITSILTRFANGEDISMYLVRRLIAEGFVEVVEVRKDRPGAGRGSNVYGLTGKGRSRVALLTRNKNRAKVVHEVVNTPTPAEPAEPEEVETKEFRPEDVITPSENVAETAENSGNPDEEAAA